MQLAGQMTREVVLGLMDVLKGRADQKNRLRLEPDDDSAGRQQSAQILGQRR